MLFRVSASIEHEELESVGKGIGRVMDHFNRFGLVVHSSKTAFILFRNSQRKLVIDELWI